MKKYVIVPTQELTQAMIDSCDQTSLNTVRKSLDQTETVLSYDDTQPAPLGGYRELTWDDILPIMQSSAWSTLMGSSTFSLWANIKSMFGY